MVQKWMENVSDEYVRELEELKNNPKELENRFYTELKFGTGGLRGIVGVGTNCMNEYTVAKASRGIAEYMLNRNMKKIAVSYDSRRKSEVFARTAACIFADKGIFVVIVKELMPTPYLSFLTRETGCDMGIMITASHNPKEYNGYKVYNGQGCQITDGVAKDVAAFIEKQDYFDDFGTPFEELVSQNKIVYADDEIEDKYLSGINAITGADLSGLKVAYTALNGTGYRIIPKMLKGAGAEVVVVKEQCVPDENFTTCPYPNPEMPEALTLGLKVAEENECDILIATDPDADRVGIAVRQDGNYYMLTGNEVGLVMAKFLLEENKGKISRPLIIKTIVTTSLIEEIAKDYGAEVVSVLTGFKYIGEQINMLEEKSEEDRFLLGFEESYGYLLGTQVRDKDAPVAVMAICKIAGFCAKKGTNLKNLLQEIYGKYGKLNHKLLSFEFKGADGNKKMQALISKFRSENISEIAGKKVLSVTDYLQSEKTGLPKSNVLAFDFGNSENAVLRPSGTEPKLKVYLSFKSGAEQLEEYFKSNIN